MRQASQLAVWLMMLAVLLAASPASGEEPWSFELTPYLWASGLHGDLSARGRTASVDSSFSDLVKDPLTAST